MCIVGMNEAGQVTLDGKVVLRFSSARLEVTVDEGGGSESTHPIVPALAVVLAGMGVAQPRRRHAVLRPGRTPHHEAGVSCLALTSRL